MEAAHLAWESVGGSLMPQLAPQLMRLGAALLILLAAWLGAGVVRRLVGRMGSAARLDERLRNPGLARLLGEIAGWFVWLMAMPALLGTLQLEGLLQPLNVMMARLFGFLPNLMGAAVVLGVGLLLANIVRRLAESSLRAAGSERATERLGLATALGERSLAGMAGMLVYALVLLPTVAAAMHTLGLEVVSRPVSQLLETVTALVPKLFAAAVILVVAGLISRLLANVAAAVLAGLGINRLPQALGLPGPLRPGGRDMAELGGQAVTVAVMMLALAQAAEVLGFTVLTGAVSALGTALVRVGVAALVMVAGLWLANLVAGLVAASGVARAALAARWTRLALIIFSAALALRQADLPGEIVALAFGSLSVALGLALALALGLGGREVAARWLQRTLEPPPPALPEPPAATAMAATTTMPPPAQPQSQPPPQPLKPPPAWQPPAEPTAGLAPPPAPPSA